ncbi:hypothetical protein COV22_00930 [Candidatus Woesearchaeota archaeon CG10_big_fil_rev_8_21_14_0_10_47_5]|nr:MAG: hypothetical protein COV22_00930 [Candidatus Woesearchaeota archaeon CG10_big_fil_rev_8_21_14_0_10_47_5]
MSGRHKKRRKEMLRAQSSKDEASGRSVMRFYDRNYKKILIAASALFIICTLFVLYNYINTGELFKKDVSLKGGVTMTIEKDIGASPAEVKGYLYSRFPAADLIVRSISAASRSGLLIEASDADAEGIITALSEKYGPIERSDYSVDIVGSSLGSGFMKAMMLAVLMAFIFMAVTVFIYFRMLVPSLFIVWCALADIISTLAVVNILGIKLSTAGLATFLMLIGYSVDTDILLTARVLKTKEGGINERIRSAFKTGITMSLTTLVATATAYFLSEPGMIKQIMLIISIGMVFDMLYTWLINAGVLKLYLQSKKQRGVL